MKVWLIYSSTRGVSNLPNSQGGYSFETIEQAKEAATDHAKSGNINKGAYLIRSIETFKVLSSFTFPPLPPLPPLEGWVDVK